MLNSHIGDNAKRRDDRNNRYSRNDSKDLKDRNDRNDRKDRNDLKILKIPEELRLVRPAKASIRRKKKTKPAVL
jgi:hypothetical protein